LGDHSYFCKTATAIDVSRDYRPTTRLAISAGKKLPGEVAVGEERCSLNSELYRGPAKIRLGGANWRDDRASHASRSWFSMRLSSAVASLRSVSDSGTARILQGT